MAGEPVIVRLGLIGDTHGYLPALEAAIRGCKAAGVDHIIHCGDFLSVPFSPDPPDENIDLLRAEEVTAVYGNHEVYLMHWGTSKWESTLAQRMRRPDKPGDWMTQVGEGQAAISAENLAWLRQLTGELALDCARPGDVYVCHAMPGDPFSTIWDGDAKYNPAFPPGEIEQALSRPLVANSDLILCGHVPYPLVQRTALPNGRKALVIRGVGWMRGEPDGTGWTTDYWVLETTSPASHGFRAWEMQRHVREFKPR